MKIDKEKFLKNDYLFGVVIAAVITLIFFSKFYIGNNYFSAADILYKYNPWKTVASSDYLYPSNELRTDDIYLNHPDYAEIDRQSDKTLNIHYTENKLAGESLNGFSYLFSPVLIPFLIFDANTATNISLMLRFFFALYGMFLFIRSLELSKAAALFGAIAFSGSTSFFSWVNTPIASTFCFIPFSLILITKLFKQKDNKLLFATLYALITGFSYLPGHPPSNIIYLFICGFWFVYLNIFDSKFDKKKFLINSIIFAVINLLSILYSACVLFPTVINSLSSSHLSRGGGDFSLGPVFLLTTYLLPNIFGNPAHRNWAYAGNFNEYVSYAGILTIILSILSFIYSKNKKHYWFFLIMAGISLGIAFNIPPFSLVNNTFGFKQIPPLRWNISLIFFLSILSAFMIDRIPTIKFDFTKILNKKVVLSVFAIILTLFIASMMFIYFYKDGKFLNPNRLFYLVQYSSIALGIVIAAAVSFYLYKNSKINNFSVIIIALIIFDLMVWSWEFHPAVNSKDIFPVTPGIEFLKKDTNYRIAVIESKDFALPGNTAEYYDIKSVGGYDLYIDKEYQDFLNLMCGVNKEYSGFVNLDNEKCINPEVGRLLGIKYYVVASNTKVNNKELKNVYKGNDMDIYEDTKYVDSQFLYQITNATLATSNIAELQKNVGFSDFAKNYENCESSIKELERTEDRIKYHFSSKCDVFMLTNKKYKVGWRIRKDDNYYSVSKVNNIFAGFELKKGNYEFELIQYNQLSEVTSLITTITSGGLISLLAFSLLRYKRSY